jgi:hypothetical protein
MLSGVRIRCLGATSSADSGHHCKPLHPCVAALPLFEPQFWEDTSSGQSQATSPRLLTLLNTAPGPQNTQFPQYGTLVMPPTTSYAVDFGLVGAATAFVARVQNL